MRPGQSSPGRWTPPPARSRPTRSIAPRVDPPIDPEAFKDALARLASGVAIISCWDDGAPRGLLVSSITGLSVDPPRFLFCVRKEASSHDALVRAGHCSVAVLAEGCETEALRFSSSSLSHERFHPSSWRLTDDAPPTYQAGLSVATCRSTRRPTPAATRCSSSRPTPCEPRRANPWSPTPGRSSAWRLQPHQPTDPRPRGAHSVRSIRVRPRRGGRFGGFEAPPRLDRLPSQTGAARENMPPCGATGASIFNDNVVIENIGLFPSVRRVMVRAKASKSFANLQQDVKCRTKGWR